MNDPKNPSLWGVQGLNEAEQRQVRGGARADCIRNAIRNYANNRRNNPGDRSYQLSSLLSDIANANCSSGSN